MRSLAVRLLVTFVALLWAPSALAQAMATLDRAGEPHESGSQYDISREDCEDDEEFVFSIPLTPPANADRLEVWLSEGSDNCASADERNLAGTTCQKVDVPTSLDNSGSSLVVKPTTRQLADALSDVADCVDSSGVTAKRSVTVYFLIFTGGGNEEIPVENYGTWAETAIDLLGPGPATISEATPADAAFTVTLADVTFTGDAKRFQLFCDPIIVDEGEGGGGANAGGGSATAAKPQGPGVGGGGGVGGAGGAGGAGVGGAGGAGVGGAGGAGGANAGGTNAGGANAGGANAGGAGGGTSSADCGTGKLVAGAVPPLEYACGAAISAGSEIVVKNAVNNRTYAVGVAGVDALGNPGVLSPLVCVTPLPVDDFFTVYNRAGGEGGCIGGCATAPHETAGVLGAFALLALLVVRRRVVAISKRSWWAVFGVSIAVTPLAAEAQSAIADTNWRHRHRPDPPPADVDFAFEVRFGPYWANVDDEPALNGATPYEDTFGNDGRFYFGLEFDYMPIRIPYVGTLGAGVGWGYTWNSALAKLTVCPEGVEREDEKCDSADTTSLDIMPMHASVVLRGDELMRRTGVPIVPYGKFGFGWAYWKATKTSGVTQIPVDGEKEKLFGEDVTIGLHAALGAALALNWLDARSAGSLRESTGIAHMYLVAEWMNAMLTGLGGGQMRVGTSTFVTGLAADF